MDRQDVKFFNSKENTRGKRLWRRYLFLLYLYICSFPCQTIIIHIIRLYRILLLQIIIIWILKDEMDESLYKMVVGYVTVDGFDDAEELKSPYVLIKDLRKEFRNLKKITTDTESKLWLDSLLRNIDTLEDRSMIWCRIFMWWYL